MTRIEKIWPSPDAELGDAEPGDAELNDAGLSDAGLGDDDIATLYAIADRRTPWLRANFVSSLDGAATHGGLSGGLSSAADKRVFDILRRLSDVVLVGAGTVRAEGYGPMRLDPASVSWRQEHGLPAQPVFAIVSGSLDLDLASTVFIDAPVRPIVITTSRASSIRLTAIERVADTIVCGTDAIDSDAARTALADRGLMQVLCEGGPTLFGSLLAADSVDELCLTLSPQLEAGNAGRIAVGAAPEARRLSLAHTLISGDSLMLRYLLDRR